MGRANILREPPLSTFNLSPSPVSGSFCGRAEAVGGRPSERPSQSTWPASASRRPVAFFPQASVIIAASCGSHSRRRHTVKAGITPRRAPGARGLDGPQGRRRDGPETCAASTVPSSPPQRIGHIERVRRPALRVRRRDGLKTLSSRAVQPRARRGRIRRASPPANRRGEHLECPRAERGGESPDCPRDLTWTGRSRDDGPALVMFAGAPIAGLISSSRMQSGLAAKRQSANRSQRFSTHSEMKLTIDDDDVGPLRAGSFLPLGFGLFLDTWFGCRARGMQTGRGRHRDREHDRGAVGDQTSVKPPVERRQSRQTWALDGRSESAPARRKS